MPRVTLIDRYVGRTVLGALVLVLLAPTMVLVNLRFPRLRRVFEFTALLPISIPAIVLVVGLAPIYLQIGRMLGTGPVFLKLGSRVLYSLAEVEAHERERTRRCTAGDRPSEVWA